MKTAYLLEQGDEFSRLVKIRFIYYRPKDPPYSMWWHYRKVGNIYVLENERYSHWIPEDEQHLEDGVTHKIKIVWRPIDIKPLKLEGIKSRLYGKEKAAYENRRKERHVPCPTRG